MKKVINFADKLFNPIFFSSMAIKPKNKECYDLVDIRKYTYIKTFDKYRRGRLLIYLKPDLMQIRQVLLYNYVEIYIKKTNVSYKVINYGEKNLEVKEIGDFSFLKPEAGMLSNYVMKHTKLQYIENFYFFREKRINLYLVFNSMGCFFTKSFFNELNINNFAFKFLFTNASESIDFSNFFVLITNTDNRYLQGFLLKYFLYNKKYRLYDNWIRKSSKVFFKVRTRFLFNFFYQNARRKEQLKNPYFFYDKFLYFIFEFFFFVQKPNKRKKKIRRSNYLILLETKLKILPKNKRGFVRYLWKRNFGRKKQKNQIKKVKRSSLFFTKMRRAWNFRGRNFRKPYPKYYKYRGQFLLQDFAKLWRDLKFRVFLKRSRNWGFFKYVNFIIFLFKYNKKLYTNFLRAKKGFIYLRKYINFPGTEDRNLQKNKINVLYKLKNVEKLYLKFYNYLNFLIYNDQRLRLLGRRTYKRFLLTTSWLAYYRFVKFNRVEQSLYYLRRNMAGQVSRIKRKKKRKYKWDKLRLPLFMGVHMVHKRHGMEHFPLLKKKSMKESRFLLNNYSIYKYNFWRHSKTKQLMRSTGVTLLNWGFRTQKWPEDLYGMLIEKRRQKWRKLNWRFGYDDDGYRWYTKSSSLRHYRRLALLPRYTRKRTLKKKGRFYKQLLYIRNKERLEKPFISKKESSFYKNVDGWVRGIVKNTFYRTIRYHYFNNKVHWGIRSWGGLRYNYIFRRTLTPPLDYRSQKKYSIFDSEFQLINRYFGHVLRGRRIRLLKKKKNRLFFFQNRRLLFKFRVALSFFNNDKYRRRLFKRWYPWKKRYLIRWRSNKKKRKLIKKVMDFLHLACEKRDTGFSKGVVLATTDKENSAFTKLWELREKFVALPVERYNYRKAWKPWKKPFFYKNKRWAHFPRWRGSKGRLQKKSKTLVSANYFVNRRKMSVFYWNLFFVFLLEKKKMNFATRNLFKVILNSLRAYRSKNLYFFWLVLCRVRKLTVKNKFKNFFKTRYLPKYPLFYNKANKMLMKKKKSNFARSVGVSEFTGTCNRELNKNSFVNRGVSNTNMSRKWWLIPDNVVKKEFHTVLFFEKKKKMSYDERKQLYVKNVMSKLTSEEKQQLYSSCLASDVHARPVGMSPAVWKEGLLLTQAEKKLPKVFRPVDFTLEKLFKGITGEELDKLRRSWDDDDIEMRPASVSKKSWSRGYGLYIMNQWEKMVDEERGPYIRGRFFVKKLEAELTAQEREELEESFRREDFRLRPKKVNFIQWHRAYGVHLRKVHGVPEDYTGTGEGYYFLAEVASNLGETQVRLLYESFLLDSINKRPPGVTRAFWTKAYGYYLMIGWEMMEKRKGGPYRPESVQNFSLERFLLNLSEKEIGILETSFEENNPYMRYKGMPLIIWHRCKAAWNEKVKGLTRKERKGILEVFTFEGVCKGLTVKELAELGASVKAKDVNKRPRRVTEKEWFRIAGGLVLRQGKWFLKKD